jgi:hypothetical protein
MLISLLKGKTQDIWGSRKGNKFRKGLKCRTVAGHGANK